MAIVHFFEKIYENESSKDLNPTIAPLAHPRCLQEKRDSYWLIWEVEYYSTLESIIEYRFTIGKPWEEEELLNNFYQILHAMQELQK